MWEQNKVKAKKMERKKRRTLKKIKDSELKIRISSEKKQEIKKYCEAEKISMTDFMDMAIHGILNK